MIVRKTSHAPDAPVKSPGLQAHLRLYGDGFVFSCDGMESRTCRYSAAVLIALGDTPFEVGAGMRTERCHAAAFRPLVTRTLRARGVPFICLDLSPNHPRYRAFQLIDGNGMLVLPREDVADLIDDARAFNEGLLNCQRTCSMRRRAIDIVTRRLPMPAPLDPRIERVMNEVVRNPSSSCEQLGAIACLSHGRLSHLFTRQVGISLRLFSQTMKIHAAGRYHGSGMSLTDIAVAAGFADAAHFSKVYSKAFGHPPHVAFHSAALEVDPLPARAMRSTQQCFDAGVDERWSFEGEPACLGCPHASSRRQQKVMQPCLVS